MFVKFLANIGAMIVISAIVAIFGVLFCGFDAHSVAISYLRCSPFLIVVYSALSLACLAMTK
jgi:hypothetical protein